MTTTPTLNGQVIGQAERATRAILDRLLARTGTTFHGWVALNVTATHGSAIDRDRLIGQLVTGLRIDHTTVLSTLADLTGTHLLASPPGAPARLELTESGRVRYNLIRADLAELTARLYGDLPADDLATAGRVLTVVTARATAELAA